MPITHLCTFFSVSAFLLMGLYLCDKMPSLNKGTGTGLDKEQTKLERVGHWAVVSIYHSLSVLSYFICVCISFGGFSPAAIPSYVLFPLVIGDLICACIKLRKTPEVMKAEAEMKAEMKAESN